MKVDVALGLGSNLGDSERSLRSALIRLTRAVEISAVSSLYRSPPAGGSAQPDYLNVACIGSSRLGAAELLAVCKRLEWRKGRRRGPRNAPRPLDIDLLIYGPLALQHPELTVPHPRLSKRSFVLVPLASIAAELEVPPTGVRVGELLARLTSADPIRDVGWSLEPPLLSSGVPSVQPDETMAGAARAAARDRSC